MTLTQLFLTGTLLRGKGRNPYNYFGGSLVNFRHQKDIKKLTDLKTVIERTTNMDKNASVTLACVIKILGRTTLSVLRIFEVEMNVIKKINNEDHGIFSVKSEHTLLDCCLLTKTILIWLFKLNKKHI